VTSCDSLVYIILLMRIRESFIDAGLRSSQLLSKGQTTRCSGAGGRQAGGRRCGWAESRANASGVVHLLYFLGADISALG